MNKLLILLFTIFTSAKSRSETTSPTNNTAVKKVAIGCHKDHMKLSRNNEIIFCG